MGDNGKFIRGIFWTLVIGSFAWATAFGTFNLLALNAHSADAEAKMTAVKSEMITRDETNLKETQNEIKDMLKQINDGFKSVATSVASLQTEVVNLKEMVKRNGRNP